MQNDERFQFHKGTIRTLCALAPIAIKMNFNSIKVQLEQTSRRPTTTLCQFQFHKGTIRTCSRTSTLPIWWNFNSIKVQLEQNKEQQTSIVSNKFQFHKGTIRTRETSSTISMSAWFQFHKGTIRTLRKSFSRIRHRHFNSIKVQLELFFCHFDFIS